MERLEVVVVRCTAQRRSTSLIKLYAPADCSEVVVQSYCLAHSPLRPEMAELGVVAVVVL